MEGTLILCSAAPTGLRGEPSLFGTQIYLKKKENLEQNTSAVLLAVGMIVTRKLGSLMSMVHSFPVLRFFFGLFYVTLFFHWIASGLLLANSKLLGPKRNVGVPYSKKERRLTLTTLFLPQTFMICNFVAGDSLDTTRMG